jgi:hypothetical protein
VPKADHITAMAMLTFRAHRFANIAFEGVSLGDGDCAQIGANDHLQDSTKT